jgi:hypothetical protein
VSDLCRLINKSRDLNQDEPTPPTFAAIAAAVELSSFDGARHQSVQAYNPDTNTEPDATTTQHTATMVDHSLAFFRQYGPVAVNGFMVAGGDTVGIGDFLTVDTLWDFKVSVNPTTSAHILQLLALWIMAHRSDWRWTVTWNWGHTMSEADWPGDWDLDAYLREHRAWPEDLHGPTPTHIGIYNPRLDTVYRLEVDSIPADAVAEVSRDVLGYK